MTINTLSEKEGVETTAENQGGSGASVKPEPGLLTDAQRNRIVRSMELAREDADEAETGRERRNAGNAWRAMSRLLAGDDEARAALIKDPRP